MPSTWTIPLAGSSSADVPAEAPHAVVSRWLDTDQTHKAPVKPYAIIPPAPRGGLLDLTVNLLDDALAARLGHAVADLAATGRQVRLGRHLYDITALPGVVRRTDWTAFACGRREWTVDFRSPATFRNGSRTSPFPAPDTVLTGLAARWSALGPPLPWTPATARTLVVADLDLHSTAFTLRNTLVSAVTGRIRYICTGTAADAACIDALFGFADYAGIGSHTAYGLGAVRISGCGE